MIFNEKEILGSIYVITNKINRKQYIGQTISNVGHRWSEHKYDAIKRNKQTALASAIRKYGVENFNIKSIQDNIPYKELDIREIEYIKEYNTICPNGYNISEGGKSYRTEKERRLMSERVKGENNPMYGAFGELNPFYGKKHSDYAKSKISEQGKLRWSNYSFSERKKHLKHLDDIREKMIELHGGGFVGKKHSEESKRVISNKLKGKTFSEEHNRKISQNSARKRKVVMLDKKTKEYINEFDSMTIAIKWLVENKYIVKGKPGAISSICLGKGKSVYGYSWMYYDEYLKNKEKLKSIE